MRFPRQQRHSAKPPHNLTNLKISPEDSGLLFWSLIQCCQWLSLYCPDGPLAPCDAVARIHPRRLCGTAASLGEVLRLVLDGIEAPTSAEDIPVGLGQRLFQAAEQCQTLIFTLRPDEICLETVQITGEATLVASSDLLFILSRASGLAEPTQRCPQCGQTKPLAAFPRDRNRASGRFSWCHVCNRRHVAEYAQHQHRQSD